VNSRGVGEGKSTPYIKIATLVAEDLWERIKEATEAGESGEVAPDVECAFEVRNEKLNRRIAALVSFGSS
jgi:hypothetical protein